MSRTTIRPARILGIELNQTTRAVILAIGGIKGGIGKSTTAMFLALCYTLLGLKVLVIDADPKSGSSRKWWRHAKKRDDALPFTVQAHPSDDLEDRIVDEGWHENFHLIIIDTGGDNDRILRAAYGIADHMLLTVSPSPADIDSLPATAQVTVGAMGSERDIPVTLLVTSVKSEPMAKDAKTELRGAGLTVLAAVVKHRTFYQKSYGWTPEGTGDYDAVRHELDTMQEETAA